MSLFLVPSRSFSTPLYPFKVLKAGSVPWALNISVVYYFRLNLNISRSLGCVTSNVHWVDWPKIYVFLEAFDLFLTWFIHLAVVKNFFDILYRRQRKMFLVLTLFKFKNEAYQPQGDIVLFRILKNMPCNR